MSKTLNIIIVDDDAKLRSLLKKFLMEHNFDVTAVSSASHAERALKLNIFDAMILDMMMPEENGLDFCKRLRLENNHIPIIMLSARGEDIDKIIGLEMGVDDYLSKPFNPRELLARIKALLRRSQNNRENKNKESYQIGRFKFDVIKRQLISQENETINLTSSEYDLLVTMVENPNIPLYRDKIMRILHAKEFEIYDRSIDVLVSRLRKTIEDDASRPKLIKTVWGVGYVFVKSNENN